METSDNWMLLLSTLVHTQSKSDDFGLIYPFDGHIPLWNFTNSYEYWTTKNVVLTWFILFFHQNTLPEHHII